MRGVSSLAEDLLVRLGEKELCSMELVIILSVDFRLSVLLQKLLLHLIKFKMQD
jgi:hypothetical protein